MSEGGGFTSKLPAKRSRKRRAAYLSIPMQRLAALLLLPDGTRVTDVRKSTSARNEVEIEVEHRELPQLKEGEVPAEISFAGLRGAPKYGQLSRGEVQTMYYLMGMLDREKIHAVLGAGDDFEEHMQNFWRIRDWVNKVNR